MSESAAFARTMAFGRKPAYYRETGLYKSKFRSYLIEKYQLRQKLLSFDGFVKQLDNKRMQQDWQKVNAELEKGNFTIDIPERVTISL